MTHLSHASTALLALLLTAACGGDDNNTTGFTGTATALTTSTAGPVTDTDTGDPGTGTAPTTSGTSSTGGSTTEPAGETLTSTGSDTGDTGTTGDTDSTSNTSSIGSSSTDAASTTDLGSTGTSTGGPDTGDTIYAIQDGTIAEGSPVVVNGVIVTAIAPDKSGLFVQEPDGGEYSGVWVTVSGGQVLANLAIGDEVDVTGTTAEIDTRTTIDAKAGSVAATGVKGLMVAPAPVLAAIFSKPLLTEPWESVLIRLDGAPLSVAGIIAAGEFKLVAKDVALVVDDFLYNVPGDFAAFPGLGAGASFTQIAGILNADGATYKLAPRRATDLVGYQKP